MLDMTLMRSLLKLQSNRKVGHPPMTLRWILTPYRFCLEGDDAVVEEHQLSKPPMLRMELQLRPLAGDL